MKPFESAVLLGLLLVMMTACATTKKLDLWQDEGFSGPLKKTLIISVAQQDHIRNQLENVLVDKLTSRGVNAVASHKVYPELGEDTDREVAKAKVLALGVEDVIVMRSIDKREITNHKGRGDYSSGAVRRNYGWHGYYRGSFPLVQRTYDTQYFTMDTSIHHVGNEEPVWHYLSQVRVEGSKQMAVNEFVPVLVEQIANSNLLP